MQDADIAGQVCQRELRWAPRSTYRMSLLEMSEMRELQLRGQLGVAKGRGLFALVKNTP